MVRCSLTASSSLLAPFSWNFLSFGENARARKNNEQNKINSVMTIHDVLHVHGPEITSNMPDKIRT